MRRAPRPASSPPALRKPGQADGAIALRMRAMPKRRRRRDRAGAGEQGFTLIEIMVALAVFSLAVLALVRLESATIRGATILDDTLVANLVARNVANEALTEGRVPTLGRSAGVENNAGCAWRWVRDVRPTGNARIVRIDVAVADRRGVAIGRATAVRPPDDQP